MSDLAEGQELAGRTGREEAAAAVAEGRLPLFLDPRERARVMAEAAREELESDVAEPGGSHASRAAAYAALAVYERMEADAVIAEHGPDVFEKRYQQVAKDLRTAERFEQFEVAADRFEAWAQRTIGDRLERWADRYEQALRRRGL